MTYIDSISVSGPLYNNNSVKERYQIKQSRTWNAMVPPKVFARHRGLQFLFLFQRGSCLENYGSFWFRHLLKLSADSTGIYVDLLEPEGRSKTPNDGDKDTLKCNRTGVMSILKKKNQTVNFLVFIRHWISIRHFFGRQRQFFIIKLWWSKKLVQWVKPNWDTWAFFALFILTVISWQSLIKILTKAIITVKKFGIYVEFCHTNCHS